MYVINILSSESFKGSECSTSALSSLPSLESPAAVPSLLASISSFRFVSLAITLLCFASNFQSLFKNIQAWKKPNQFYLQV